MFITSQRTKELHQPPLQSLQLQERPHIVGSSVSAPFVPHRGLVALVKDSKLAENAKDSMDGHLLGTALQKCAS